jgi:hypothetical protein
MTLSATRPGHSPAPKDYSRGPGGGYPHPRVPARGARLQRRSLGLNSGLSFLFFFSFVIVVIYILTHTHTHIGKLVSLNPCVPESATVASRGPRTQARHTVPP